VLRAQPIQARRQAALCANVPTRASTRCRSVWGLSCVSGNGRGKTCDYITEVCSDRDDTKGLAVELTSAHC
jgi:hypothetical protein